MTSTQPQAAKIKLFITDCDGCLTDAGMYYSSDGAELKRFSARDGMGFALLRDAQILIGIITSEDTPIVANRAAKLQIDEYHPGAKNKLRVLRDILHRHNLQPSEVAYVGDDINDLPALRICGLTFCPQDATAAIKEQASVVLTQRGGHGAVRAAAEHVLAHNQEL